MSLPAQTPPPTTQQVSQQRTFTVLGESHWFRSFADLASRIPRWLANLPGRIVFTCVADWVSRTRLLQTMPRGIALTLCFLFSHGLTMQDFHLR